MATKQADFIHAWDTYWNHVERAERDIRENGHRGRLPPICYGDPWDEEFAAAYEAVRPFLRKFLKIRYYPVPVGLAFCMTPIKAETALQALMFFLNPAAELYGEAGVLDSAEFKAIKAAALLEFQRRDDARVAKTRISACTRKAKTKSQLVELRGVIFDHHFPKGEPFRKETLESKEIEALFGWSQSTVNKKMKLLFKGQNGMTAYAAVFDSHATTKGYNDRLEDQTLRVEAIWEDRRPEDNDEDDDDDDEGKGCRVLRT